MNGSVSVVSAREMGPERSGAGGEAAGAVDGADVELAVGGAGVVAGDGEGAPLTGCWPPWMVPVMATAGAIASFYYTSSFDLTDANYVEYEVVTTNGGSTNNPGLANFALTGPAAATPERASLTLLGTGRTGLAMLRRRFKK